MAKPICPGVDLRPLQHLYRRKLGDLARLRANKSLYLDLYPYIEIYIDYESAELAIKAWYQKEKVRLITSHLERQKELVQ